MRMIVMMMAALLGLGSAANAQDSVSSVAEAARSGDTAELVSAQWRGGLSGAEVVEAERLLVDAPRGEAGQVAAAAYDLLMIRQDWRESAPTRLATRP